MKSINLGEYEYGDLIRYLEKLKEFIANQPVKDGFDDRYFDLERINILLDRVKKNNYRPDYNLQRGTYKETILNETEEQMKRRKYQKNYENKKGRKEINIWKD